MAMNRIFHIVLLSLSVAACTVYSGTDCCRSASNLESFSVRLVGLSSAYAVDMLCDRSEPSDAINDPDFRIYDYLEYAQGSRIDYYIVRSSDGVWDVTISGDVTLCLNGKTLSMGDNTITVSGNAVLTI